MSYIGSAIFFYVTSVPLHLYLGENRVIADNLVVLGFLYIGCLLLVSAGNPKPQKKESLGEQVTKVTFLTLAFLGSVTPWVGWQTEKLLIGWRLRIHLFNQSAPHVCRLRTVLFNPTISEYLYISKHPKHVRRRHLWGSPVHTSRNSHTKTAVLVQS